MSRKLPPKCEGCGLLLCFKCGVHVDAPDHGLVAVCEECAAEICAERGVEAVHPGGLLHLEAYYVMDDDIADEEELPSEPSTPGPDGWN